MPIKAGAGETAMEAKPATEGSRTRIEAILEDVRESRTRLTPIYFVLLPITILAYIALTALVIWLLFQIPALLTPGVRY